MQEEQQVYHDGLNRISSLDGRDVLFTRGLEERLSEGELHRQRAVVEIENLIALTKTPLFPEVKLTDEEKSMLRIIASPRVFDTKAVADYDHFGRNDIGPLEHDVKAV